MTFCKVLKEQQIGPYTVSAYENYDKFCTVPRYEIVTSRSGIAVDVVKTAKSTWRRKFRSVAESI